MEWRDLDLTNCPMIGALAVIGRPWTLQILRETMNGVRRFDDLQDHLRVSRPVLSRRLRELVDDGLLERRPYREPGDRQRQEYHPTAKAWDLFPVMIGLLDWGEHHLDLPDGPPTEVRTRADGRRVRAAVVTEDADALGPRDVRLTPGPGLRWRTPPAGAGRPR